MCGIVGLVSAYRNGFSGSEWDAFTQMLYLDTFRGEDSTGAFFVDTEGNVVLKKQAIPGYSFINSAGYKSFRSDMLSSGLIAVGHNRAATRGSITDANAHPFVADNKIVLVHNGSFWGSHKHLKDTDVDSEAIAHVLAENTDVEKALSKLHCAYSLVWWNTEKDELNLIRNSHRPLHLCYLASGAFLFASEAATLHYVLAKQDWKVKHAPYLLKEDHLVTVSLNQKKQRAFIQHDCRDVKIETPKEQEDPQSGGTFRSVGQLPSSENARPTALTHYRGAIQSFRDLLPNQAPHFLLSKEAGETLWQSLRSVPLNNKSVFIEVQDFCSADVGNPKGTAWWVYGTMVLPEEREDTRNVCVYWIVNDKSELEVIEYATAGIFQVRVNNMILNTFVDKTGTIYKYLTCFGVDANAVAKATDVAQA